MKATLIYNNSAGQRNSLSPEKLLEALHEAGYDAVYPFTKTADDLDAVLEDVEGLVVSAGGDGTAKAVATRLLGKEAVAMTILPMGTANNLARTLGIDGKPLDIIERLRDPQKHRFDVGRVKAPWGEDTFLEGVGLGLFAQVLATYKPEKGKSVTRSVKSLVEVLGKGYGQRTTLRLPDQEISSEFLLVEVLNAQAVGPRLKLAPDADPTDGLLHVVCIDAEKKDSYFKYLRSLVSEDMDSLPSVGTYAVPKLEIAWDGFPFHIDDYVQPRDFDYRQEDDGVSSLKRFPDVPEGATIQIEVLPQSLNMILPECEDGEAYGHKN